MFDATALMSAGTLGSGLGAGMGGGASLGVPGAIPGVSMGGAPAGAGNILGMTPAQFASMAGGLGAAIAPENSWQKRVGGFAQQLGMQQLQAQAADIKAKNLNSTMQEAIKARPEFAKAIEDLTASLSGSNGAPANPPAQY